MLVMSPIRHPAIQLGAGQIIPKNRCRITIAEPIGENARRQTRLRPGAVNRLMRRPSQAEQTEAVWVDEPRQPRIRMTRRGSQRSGRLRTRGRVADRLDAR